jgi:hypothetical protein
MKEVRFKGYILYDSIYMTFRNKKSYRDRKYVRTDYNNGTFGGDGNILYLHCSHTPYAFIKIHVKLYTKIVDSLYLNYTSINLTKISK